MWWSCAEETDGHAQSWHQWSRPDHWWSKDDWWLDEKHHGAHWNWAEEKTQRHWDSGKGDSKFKDIKGQGKGSTGGICAKGGKGGKGGKGKHADGAHNAISSFTVGGLVAEDSLGWGASGACFRGAYQTEHGIVPVAIKPASNWCETQAFDRIHSAHPPLPCVVPVMLVQHSTPAGDVNVTALASHGTLGDFLQSTPRIEEASFLAIIACIAEGLTALHSKGIIHCDLKPDNVVVHMTQNEEVCLWLIDFGDARLLDEPSLWRWQGPGDPAIQCKPDNESGQYSSRTDSWCLAQCAALLWNGDQRRSSNPAWMQSDMPLSQVLEQCLAWDPSARPEAAGVAQAAQTALSSRGLDVKSELHSFFKAHAVK